MRRSLIPTTLPVLDRKPLPPRSEMQSLFQNPPNDCAQSQRGEYYDSSIQKRTALAKASVKAFAHFTSDGRCEKSGKGRPPNFPSGLRRTRVRPEYYSNRWELT